MNFVGPFYEPVDNMGLSAGKYLNILVQITFQNDSLIVSYWHELTTWSLAEKNV